VIEPEPGLRDFLTNERVNGELLSERLARGPLRAEEAVRYAIEIGRVLHRAHLRGKVHGALSPSSILAGPGGVRILQPGGAAAGDAGAYSAPEQLSGGKPDERSDIFAYGALLYELANGRPAFTGTGEELAHQILQEAPPEPEASSRAYDLMRPVIASCLEKDPVRRRQRVQNAVTELRFAARTLRVHKPRGTRKPAPLRFLRSARPLWFAAAALVLLAAAAGGYLLLRPPGDRTSYAFQVEPPLNTEYPGVPVVAPDGRAVVFPALGPDGSRRLWIRPLDSLRNSPLPGTEDASWPFWSPDGTNIGYFAKGWLKRVAIAGGPPETIAATGPGAAGGTWNSDGVILFASGNGGGLYRVRAAANQKPELVLKPDAASGERAFRWPAFLPDQKRFLFFVRADSAASKGVYAGALDSREYRCLLDSDTNALYSPPRPGEPGGGGYLLYMRGRDLMAQRFDASRLSFSGEPHFLLGNIGSLAAIALEPVSVSNNGTLVYQAVPEPTRQLVWLDRGGAQAAAVHDPGHWGEPRISPDGTRALAAKLEPDGKHANLWMLDQSGAATRLSDTPLHQASPVWSPEGKRIAFFETSTAPGFFEVVTSAQSAAAHPEVLFRSSFQKIPSDWSHDGQYLILTAMNPGTKADVWAFSFSARRAEPVVGTVSNEGYGALSPDGKWLAFQSDESGRNEVYVEAFAGLDWSTRRHYRVSNGGGRPRWRGDSRELYYMTQDGRVMAVAVDVVAGEFTAEPARTLFSTEPLPATWNLFDAAPDGSRFLVNVPLELAARASMTVITNWTQKRGLSAPVAE
jgi:Tol biopolymer transport system component